MWLLHFLPDSFLLFIINSILFVGAVSFFLAFFVLHKILNKFPALAQYHLAFQVVSAILLIAGIYFKGGYSVEMQWRERVTELEAKLKVAEEKSAQVNTVVQEKVITKTKVVREKADTIIQYVDRPVVSDFDKKCPIPKEVIDIHNEAAEMNLIIDKQLKGAKK
jgi:hypothetical protein